MVEIELGVRREMRMNQYDSEFREYYIPVDAHAAAYMDIPKDKVVLK